MQDRKAPTLETAERAAVIWKRMLLNRKYDNGGRDFPSAIASMMASKLPSNAEDPVIMAKFCRELQRLILIPTNSDNWGRSYRNAYQAVDYQPCSVLREAAEYAGLKVEFPWKTSVEVASDRVLVHCGYGAPFVFHYKVPGGWLITTLHGSDDDVRRLIAFHGRMRTQEIVLDPELHSLLPFVFEEDEENHVEAITEPQGTRS